MEVIDRLINNTNYNIDNRQNLGIVVVHDYDGLNLVFIVFDTRVIIMNVGNENVFVRNYGIVFHLDYDLLNLDKNTFRLIVFYKVNI